MQVSADHPYQAVLMRDIKTQVEALKTREAGEGGMVEGRGMYEVYTRTEAAKFAHLSKVCVLWWAWPRGSCDLCGVFAAG